MGDDIGKNVKSTGRCAQCGKKTHRTICDDCMCKDCNRLNMLCTCGERKKSVAPSELAKPAAGGRSPARSEKKNSIEDDQATLF